MFDFSFGSFWIFKNVEQKTQGSSGEAGAKRPLPVSLAFSTRTQPDIRGLPDTNLSGRKLENIDTLFVGLYYRNSEARSKLWDCWNIGSLEVALHKGVYQGTLLSSLHFLKNVKFRIGSKCRFQRHFRNLIQMMCLGWHFGDIFQS